MKHLEEFVIPDFPGMPVVETDSVAMEGITDSVKNVWAALKQKFSPTDHGAIVARLSYLPKLRKMLIDVKQKVSTGDDNGQVSVNIHRFAQHLPVSATTGEQLVKELVVHRRRIEALIVTAERAKTPEEIKKVREQLLLELSKKGNVSSEMVFTKRVVLQVLDEAIALLDVVSQAGGVYTKSYEEAKTKGTLATESYQSCLALESYEEALEVALESLGGVLVGFVVLIGSIVARVLMYFAWIMGIGCLITGQFAQALGLFIAAELLDWISQAGADYADKGLNEKEGDGK